ncbi:MAG TPA: hypothetical protein VE964_04255 [Myxococcales bacterium]|nr:hypothetical protein [Myxococcales bacterium]
MRVGAALNIIVLPAASSPNGARTASAGAAAAALGVAADLMAGEVARAGEGRGAGWA